MQQRALLNMPEIACALFGQLQALASASGPFSGASALCPKRLEMTGGAPKVPEHAGTCKSVPERARKCPK
eukprot:15485712-Alexandrium_andersonii.AAC.1